MTIALSTTMLLSTTLFAADAKSIDLSIEDILKLQLPEKTQKEKIRKKMLNVKVSSVAKSSQPLSNAAAAVFVIDQEAIKRSGATNVPEALRIAPGIDVARINNSKWAITARGFNGRFANKLLVLIDGRSVYTPDFAGVYWDAQDVMLEDVDRIEVIRGPGATLWGANAMNGVINIITKHSEDTQGGLLNAGGGSQLTGFGSLRYGKQLAENTFARAYVKGFNSEQFQPDGEPNGRADWQQFQGGFRLDTSLSEQNNLMLQGNAYKGNPNQTLKTFQSPIAFQDLVKTQGWNFNSRFNHFISSTADYSVQFNYEHYQREEYSVNNQRDLFDLDFQHSFALNTQQNMIWGLAYRYSNDSFKNQSLVSFDPTSRNTQLFSAFAQDEISFFNDELLLTLGSKFEHNDFTGFEIQPSASLIWSPSSGHKVWTSISRAVRTPSRAEANSRFLIMTLPPSSGSNPLPVTLNLFANGSPGFKAEQQLSYQLGYRFAFNSNVSWDIAAFYNDYTTLRSASYGSLTLNTEKMVLEQAANFNNISYGNTYGFESAAVWQLFDWWRWDLSYSLLQTKLYNIDNYQAAFSPDHMISLRAAINPIEKVTLDLWLRHSTAAITVNPYARKENTVNGYVTLDARIAWQALRNLEISIVGQNLIEEEHFEYFDESYALPTEVPRSVYGKISWQF